MRIFLRLATYFAFASASSATSLSVAADNYVYYNCSDQQSGIPLVGCAELTVDATLSHVMIIDYGSNAKDFTEDRDYFYVASPILPIAVPRRNYKSIDDWRFRGVSYKKVKRNLSLSLLGSKKIVDVVSALREGKPVLTFWYTEASGIEAIAFPTQSQSGDVYFCSGPPCLFAK